MTNQIANAVNYTTRKCPDCRMTTFGTVSTHCGCGRKLPTIK